MNIHKSRQRQSLALLTDFYEITMAYAYWKSGFEKDCEAVFHMFYRTNPFNGGFVIACGLGTLVDFLENFSFDSSDIDYLKTIRGTDGGPLFDGKFLDFLSEMRLRCDIDAVPEGTVVFPFEPLVRVRGPIIDCQILETVILNIINFQSLVATKAARVCLAARRDPVLEFGLRRAQGVDGALSASRAAYIGGCDRTSNVLAGKMYGIPVAGTHAHSWVMAFDEELESFKAYARALPDACVFLVDTYDTLQGVRKAVEAGQWLRSQGKDMAGIRLDSGDLAYLSVEARKILDQGGFPDAKIFASNELDETIIASLKDQGARIAVWGVGTKLVTGYDQAALDGVYKISAIRHGGKPWRYAAKVSEQKTKISNPGIQQVRRFHNERENIADMIYDAERPPSGDAVMIDPMDITRKKKLPEGTSYRDLLVPVFKKGKLVYQSPEIHEIRREAMRDLDRFHSGIKRFVYPHQYPVGLEKSFYELKMGLIEKERARK